MHFMKKKKKQTITNNKTTMEFWKWNIFHSPGKKVFTELSLTNLRSSSSWWQCFTPLSTAIVTINKNNCRVNVTTILLIAKEHKQQIMSVCLSKRQQPKFNKPSCVHLFQIKIVCKCICKWGVALKLLESCQKSPQCCKVEHPIYHMVVPINLRREKIPDLHTDGTPYSTCKKFGEVIRKKKESFPMLLKAFSFLITV